GLATVGVAHDADVDEVKRELPGIVDVAREQNQSRTRAEDGPPLGVELLQRGNEAPGLHQLEQRRALAAGDDETIDVRELRGLAHFDRLDFFRPAHAAARERLGMPVEVALEREDADLHRYQPLVCIRSFSASLLVSMPTIGSPRSSLTRTSTCGSLKCVVAWTTVFARLAGSVVLKIPDPAERAEDRR